MNYPKAKNSYLQHTDIKQISQTKKRKKQMPLSKHLNHIKIEISILDFEEIQPH